MTRGSVCIAAASMALAGLACPAEAQTLIDEWASAKLPAAPTLKPVKIANAKETALLVMDFTRQTCSQQRRPRCAVSVAKVAKLVAEARTKGALVIFSVWDPAAGDDPNIGFTHDSHELLGPLIVLRPRDSLLPFYGIAQLPTSVSHEFKGRA